MRSSAKNSIKNFAECFSGLLIQRMQHRMSRAVRRSAGAMRDALAEMSRHATEGTLINQPLLGA